MTKSSFILVLAAVCGIAAPAAGQAPPASPVARLTNANIRPVASSGALTAQFKALVDQQVAPAWIAYTQPIVDGTLASCCYGWSDNGSGQGVCCVGCPLEGRSNVMSVTEHNADESARAPGQAIKLEGATDFVMLFRIENRRVDRVRVYSADCALDVGGLTVHAITGVKAADSLALLESLVTTWQGTTNRRSAPDSLVAGVALHRDSAADGVLKKLIEPGQPDDVRRRATFWLARARGRAGFEAVRRLMRDDPSERVRKHAVFAVGQSREPEAEVVGVLIEAARASTYADVRGEALFWLAQRASRQAAEAITRAIEQDPDTEVKVRAVAALGQLPKDEGVPLLINVARTNRNPAVRKRAMHWLGQSKDPRAIDFFESVLK
jgi:hypothetical protein